MKLYLLSYIFSIIPLAVLDALWLSTMLKRFYSPKLAHLTAQNPSFTPAVIFYFIYALGITVLIVLPAIHGGYSLIKVFLLGALLGLVAYGAYDFTNQATLKDWPTVVTIVDLAWGAFLTGTAATFSVYITKLFS